MSEVQVPVGRDTSDKFVLVEAIRPFCDAHARYRKKHAKCCGPAMTCVVGRSHDVQLRIGHTV